MDEGKLASKALTQSEGEGDGLGETNTDAGIQMKGRFNSPIANSLEVASEVSEDEEAISQMAKRFRVSGRARRDASAPSLDSQQDELGGEVSGDDLQNFLLEALDSDESEAAPAAGPALAQAPGGQVEVDDVSVADTQRIEPSAPDGQTGQLTPKPQEPGEEADAAGVACPSCHAQNPDGMRYCVQCGGSLAQAAARGAQASPAAPEPVREPPPPSAAAKQENPWDIQLISINEDGSDGIAISLEYLETTLGRDGDTRFPTDAFLSPKHARLHVEKGKLFIEDLYSLNGTFIKLRDEVRLTPGDTFLMGRQVLRFERFEQSITPKTKSSDGTRYMGSPSPGGNFKILQIGIGNVIQNVYCLPEGGAVLGREKGDIIFPHDKFMSSRHAQIFTGEDGQCYLVDLNSSNGTWIKIWEKTPLGHGDYIFMGQQLFRVHLKQQKK